MEILDFISEIENRNTELENYLLSLSISSRNETLKEIMKDIIKTNEVLKEIEKSKGNHLPIAERKKYNMLENIVESYTSKILENPTKKINYLREFLNHFQTINDSDKEVERREKKIIDEWSSKQNLMEKRIFTSWSLMIPKDFSEDWDENKLQLISPDDRRCITISAVTLDRNIPAEMALPPVEEFMRMGGKLHSKIKKGKLRGYIIENMMHDVFIIQCSIAGPSRLLMLTFTISNTKEDKDWAFQVIDSVKLYQS